MVSVHADLQVSGWCPQKGAVGLAAKVKENCLGAFAIRHWGTLAASSKAEFLNDWAGGSAVCLVKLDLISAILASSHAAFVKRDGFA